MARRKTSARLGRKQQLETEHRKKKEVNLRRYLEIIQF